MDHALTTVFLRQPELMKEFGVARVVVLDAHPEGPERNGAHFLTKISIA